VLLPLSSAAEFLLARRILPIPKGSSIYRNWHAFLDGHRERFGVEVAVLSDATFTGQLEGPLGPYSLLNTVPDEVPFGRHATPLVVRIMWHLDEDLAASADTAFAEARKDISSYVGGSIAEQLIALISVTHEVRVGPGGHVREFSNSDGRRGSPRDPGPDAHPLIVRGRHPVIPRAVRRQVALNASLLGAFPALKWEDARAISRAARMYRRALWLADDDPQMSWLLLVGAAETMANRWSANRKSDPVALLRELEPTLCKGIEEVAKEGAEKAIDIIAKRFATTVRTKRRFLDFLLEYGAVPPLPRPVQSPVGNFAIDWSRGALEEGLKMIYDHRSRSLHDSVPFPSPMCEAPFAQGVSPEGNEQTAWSEQPGHATYASDAVWMVKDMPMNLATFAHIVRTATVRWWQGLVSPLALR